MFKPKKLLFTVAASLPLLFISHSQAVAASLDYRGIVIDTNSNPVSGALITDTFGGFGPLEEVLTDKNGFFEIGKIGLTGPGGATITVGSTASTLQETFAASYKTISLGTTTGIENSSYPNPDIFQVKSVPEPSSGFGTLVLSGLSAGYLLKHQLKKQKLASRNTRD